MSETSSTVLETPLTIGLWGARWLLPPVDAEPTGWHIVDDARPDTAQAAPAYQALVVDLSRPVDANGSGRRATAASLAARRGLPWLPLRAEAGVVTLGPAVLPGRPGCPTCAERRRRGNDPAATGRDALGELAGLASDGSPYTLVAGPLSELVWAEASGLCRAPARVLTRDALVSVRADTLEVTRHPLLPDPRCPDCGDLPRDTPEAARFVPTARRKVDVDGLRTRRLDARELEDRYVDPVTGVVAQVEEWAQPTSACAMARLAPASSQHASDHGHGRGTDFPSARRTAVLEALERLAGLSPRGRRTSVVARYDEVADHAVDPVLLGLHDEERYATPGFPFRRYHPDQELRWVWGHSFGRGTPILVPESLVYYGHSSERPLAFETSNGCALGGCLSEAVLHGLLEVTERDAFLMTWYARLPVPEVELSSATDRRIPLLAEQTRQSIGYRLHAFATTLEHRVPTFWVMAVTEDPADPRTRVLCGAGAHPDTERALLRALRELTGFLAGTASMGVAHDQAAAAALLQDPERVRTMDDHGLLYGHPDAFERLAFLFEGEAPQSLPALAAGWSWPRHDDIDGDLSELTTRYLRAGLDVIAVDQTSPEHREAGLACAKVLVPGTLPMTFGHRFRRVRDIPRLLTVPHLLGFRHRDLSPDEINPHPHPFP